MERNMTEGGVTKSILLFAAPMILGNLFQQFYNIADTLIVGKFIGAGALAAVGSSYALMTFLTSVFIGLCMGSGVFFSMCFGSADHERFHSGVFVSFVLIGSVALLLNTLAMLFIHPILRILNTPAEIYADSLAYLRLIFCGIPFIFIYNYCACLLRAVGNSSVPLLWLVASALTNIGLDLYFVTQLHMGVGGAALATVIAQALSALGILLYCLLRTELLRLKREQLRFERSVFKQVLSYSLLTCLQQSVMNLGILMVQGLVNSFGVAVMAAFAAAVKIDSFAYMPLQDFGNAVSTFIAQNFGAQKRERIRSGLRSAILLSTLFGLLISFAVFCFGDRLMLIFVNADETEIIRIGAGYLKIEGAFYLCIGCLFLLYGLYRGIGMPGMSLVLTVISLGTRVLLSYLLAPLPAFGYPAIWWSIPIGWMLADVVGLGYYLYLHRKRRV